MLRHLRVGWSVVAGLILLFIGIVIGEKFGLYYHIPAFDKYLHVTGGIIAAWFVLSLMQSDITHLTAAKQIVLLVSTTVFIGVVWEWTEFLSGLTRYSHPMVYHFFHGGDLADTMGDLVADAAGAVLTALWALRKEMSRD